MNALHEGMKQIAEGSRGSTRSQVDPVPFTPEEMEWIRVVDEYKRAYNRPYPTCREVLALLKLIGYRKEADEIPTSVGT